MKRLKFIIPLLVLAFLFGLSPACGSSETEVAEEPAVEEAVKEEAEEEMAEPLDEETETLIIYAKRTLQFGRDKVVNKHEDVLLVLLIDVSYNVNLDNSYLLANGQKIEFYMGEYFYRAEGEKKAGIVATRLMAVVPKDILSFELHVSGKPSVKFEAEKEIYDSLDQSL